MRIFTQKTLAVAMAIGIGAVAADAAKGDPSNFDLTKLRYRVEPASVFHNNRSKAINNANMILSGEKSDMLRRAAAAEIKPATTLEAAGNIGDIDGPNGERWYYTAHFVNTEVPPHDNVIFTDYILEEYSFDIYDSNLKLVGTIKDKMEYKEDETRVPMCELTPVITRNFFNTDDKLELIIGLAVNAGPGNNRYRSVVYSLNGEKDARGYDKPVYVTENLVGDVIEGPATGNSDNFFITFMSDVIPSLDDNEDISFWDYLCSQKVRLEIYGKALSAEGPRRLLDMTLPLIQLPGDQENTSALISMVHDDQVYFSISRYKEPFYNRYDDPLNDDMSQREGNSLVIDLYKADEQAITLSSTSEIPVVLDPMNDSSGNATCLFSYFSVGGLRYSEDFLFDAPGTTPGKPGYIITRSNYQITTDNTVDSYFTYSHDGKLINTLYNYAITTLPMGDIEGFEPQQMFMGSGPWGYEFSFVDIYSGKNVTTIDCEYAYDDYSDAETLTTSIGRTPAGNSYKYVCELRYPLVDENENDIMRFIWINADGTFDHIDHVNMGKGVAYAQSYISTPALAPHAYSVNDVQTYMMLVKRGISEYVNVEELLIAQKITPETPDGTTLLNIGADSRGILSGIVPEFGKNGRLMVYRQNSDDRTYSLDVYNLPLDGDNSGIDSIVADNNGITIDGSTLKADGAICIYTVAGALAATGTDTVDLSAINPGLYIVVANGTAHKLLIQ